MDLSHPLSVELSAGQLHRHEISLKEGEFIHAVVEQHGIDIAVKVFDPEGKVVLEVDETEDVERPEAVFLIASGSGDYVFEVRSVVKDAQLGRYMIDVLERRTATPVDRVRANAEASFAAAVKESSQGGAASLRQARDAFESLVTSWHQLGDRHREAQMLCLSGDISLGLGEAPRALEALEKALPIIEGRGDAKLEGEILSNIGAACDSIGKKPRALEFYDRAIALERSSGNRRGLMGTLMNTAVVWDAMGEKRRALDILKEGSTLAQDLGDLRGQGFALSTIAKAEDDLGNKQQALDAYGQALSLVRKVGERRGEASILSNIGRVYWSVGDNRKALAFYEQSLTIRREVGDRRGEALTLNGIGKSFEDLGDTSSATERYGEALVLSRASKDARGEASVLSRLGLLNEKAGKLKEALDLYVQALALRRAAGERVSEEADLARIGTVSAELGQREKALDFLGQSLSLAKSVGDPVQEVESLTRLADLQRVDSLSEAREKLESAIRTIESLRTRIASPDLRASYVALTHRTYELHVDVLMALHRKDPSGGFAVLAFDAAERGRARALLDLLSESGVDQHAGVDPNLVAEEREQRALFDAKVERRMRIVNGKHTQEQLEEATADVERSGAEYDRLSARIRSSSPAYAALVQPEPVGLKDLQRKVLSDDAVFVEYALGKDRSFMWVVTPSSISSHEIPKRDEIESAARRVSELLATHLRREKGPEIEYEAAIARLSKMILGPAAGELVGRRLLVVADGALHYVPFAALSEPGRIEPLVMTHEIVMLPSASIAALLKSQSIGHAPASRTVAVLADPVFDAEDARVSARSATFRPVGAQTVSHEELPLPSLEDRETSAAPNRFARLPFARREARSILALVPPSDRKEALDFDASLTTARSPEIGRYRFVHFATHGVLNDAHPELSGLILSLVERDGQPQAGFLSTGEIFNLRLHAELVVLSGCETALGQEVRGEGLIGLTRAFLHAGARRVAASLWAADDAATAQLMADFYRGMLGERKLPPAAALREAQLAMRRTTNWKSPYYWAGFVLEGDWE